MIEIKFVMSHSKEVHYFDVVHAIPIWKFIIVTTLLKGCAKPVKLYHPCGQVVRKS